MDRTLRLAGVIAATACLSLGLGACGSKDSSSAGATTVATSRSTTTGATTSQATATGQATGSDQSSATSQSTTGQPSSSATPGSRRYTRRSASSADAGSCQAGATSATIGGVHKCIEAGQMCSHAHVADYGQYGFVCEQKGSAYILRKA